MKNLISIALAVIVTFILGGCAKYPVSQSTGKDDMAYLLFVSQGNNEGVVTVTLDESAPFTAKVVKQKSANRKGTAYAIATGRRKIKVTSEGKVVYDKEIFVSSQETKQILLP